MKPHIAIFVAPAHGHINPTLAVTKELVSRGYRVTYSAPERFASTLKAMGADVVTYEIAALPEGFSDSEDKSRRLTDFAADLRRALQTHEFFKANRPDVILFDSQDVSGAVLAQNSPDIPSIKLFASFAHNPSFTFSRSRGISADESWADRNVIQPLDKLLPEYRIGSYLVNDVSAHNMVFVPKFFQFRSDTFDDRFHFIGPTISDRSFYGKWSPPNTSQRIVLISLGTVLNAQVDYFRACIEALKGSPLHVIMSLGSGVDLAALGEIPPNFEIYPFISHLDVLPHASAFIGHGGMNSTMEALHHGVPMLLAPQDGLQQLIAARVVELGLGALLAPQAVPQDGLEGAVLTLLDDRPLLTRVLKTGAQMRGCNAASTAADLIDEVRLQAAARSKATRSPLPLAAEE